MGPSLTRVLREETGEEKDEKLESRCIAYSEELEGTRKIPLSKPIYI